MLYVQIEPPTPHQQGDQVYRTQQPCQALAEFHNVYVVSGSWLSPVIQNAARIADVLVLCQAIDADYLPLLKARRAANLTTIMEINDNFAKPQQSHSVGAFYRNPVTQSLTYQLANLCDGLQLCSLGLAQRFAKLHARHQVLPNQLAHAPSAMPHKPATPVRLGWGGSLGHRDDLLWIMPVLQKLLNSEQNLELCIMGPQELADLFAWAPRNKFCFTKASNLNHYQDFIKSLHIGLAPLLPTEFNLCRSDVKYLEYASAGASAICSDVLPYQKSVIHGHNGLLFKDLPELESSILSLYKNTQQRQNMAKNAFIWTHARTEAQHINTRYQFIQSCLQQPHTDIHTAQKKFSNIKQQLQEFSPDTHEHYLHVCFSAEENLLYNALLLQHKKNQESLHLLSQARRLFPKSYLPYLYSGKITTDQDISYQYLQQALHLQPQSCNAAYLLGERLFNMQKFAEAKQAWQTCIHLAPEYALAYEGIGRACLGLGDTTGASEAFHMALACNPYYRSPANRLAVISLEQGLWDVAENFLQESIHLTGGSWLEYFFLGDVYTKQLKLEVAIEHFEKSIHHGHPDPSYVKKQLAPLYLRQGNIEKAQSCFKLILNS